MIIKFKSTDGVKWYAKMPTGELTWSDREGLAEWRHDGDGRGMYKISYTGGDLQTSSDGRVWGQYGRPEPHDVGLEYAITQYNEKTN